jgi:nucleotide-binding universal stress UspA family protein
MTIVCGTDFSDNAREATLAAAAIAKRLGAALKLVHVAPDLAAASDQGAEDPLRKRAQEQADELRNRFGLEVEPLVLRGIAHETLVELAKTTQARLLVVSSLGAKKQHRWLLGSTAERVAQASPVPVLVVRDAASLVAWAQRERPLRAMVGVELAATSRPALRWAAGLRELGPCDLLVTQVAWPAGEHQRLGVRGPMPLDHLQPELLGPLSRDLRAWAGELAGEGQTTFTVSPGWGRVDTHLTLLAAESQVDLLVVGTHQRAGAARLWQGSVSRGVLHQSSCNVACVPRSDADERSGVIPTFRHVLVPTDFSVGADRAIPVGYGLVSAGGTVHLLHVIGRKPGEAEGEPKEQLRTRIPPGAIARGISTELEVVREDDAGMGIWHAANRLGVDAICMATRGRSGLSRVVLGSQAQKVLERARQPVVLVPPEHAP